MVAEQVTLEIQRERKGLIVLIIGYRGDHVDEDQAMRIGHAALAKIVSDLDNLAAGATRQ